MCGPNLFEVEGVDLGGKTVIVTGANTGIGKETARELARLGARVILACRSQSRGDAAREDIVASTGNQNVLVKLLDLSSLQSVRDFAADFNAAESRLDILVNNAGVYATERKQTVDGFELMFGTNHLGHFLLTLLLLDKLKASAPSRVVILSSIGHERFPLKLDDLQSEKSFSAMNTYGQSKAANIMFGIQLTKELSGTGVTCYSVHPGFVQTELARDTGCVNNPCCWCLMSCFWRCFQCQRVLNEEEGAHTTLYCCLEPSIAQTSGRYYSNVKEHPAKPHATDDERAKKLWDISVELVGLK